MNFKVFLQNKTLVSSTFFSLCVLLVAVCAFVAETAVSPLRPHLAKKVTQATEPSLTQQIEKISFLTKDTLETVIDINFYGFFMLCVIAAYLHVHWQQKKYYAVALFTHFICLCISYFWLSDMLFVFNKYYQLNLGVKNMSVLLVATKLVIALVFITGFFVLTRALIKNNTPSKS